MVLCGSIFSMAFRDIRFIIFFRNTSYLLSKVYMVSLMYHIPMQFHHWDIGSRNARQYLWFLWFYILIYLPDRHETQQLTERNTRSRMWLSFMTFNSATDNGSGLIFIRSFIEVLPLHSGTKNEMLFPFQRSVMVRPRSLDMEVYFNRVTIPGLVRLLNFQVFIIL